MHAALGKWLEREQQRGQDAELPEEVHHFTKPGHPSVVLWGARTCLSLGSLIVVVVASLAAPNPSFTLSHLKTQLFLLLSLIHVSHHKAISSLLLSVHQVTGDQIMQPPIVIFRDCHHQDLIQFCPIP